MFKRIIKNSLYLSTRTVLNKILYLILTIFIVKFLGAGGLGEYVFFTSLVWFIVHITHLDLFTLGIKILTRYKFKKSKIFTNLLFINLIGWIIKTLSIITIINFIQIIPSKFEIVVYLTLLSNLFMVFVNPAIIAFYAYEKMEYPSLLNLIRDILIVGISLVMLNLGYGIISLVIIGVVGEMFRFLSSMILIRKIFFNFSFKDLNLKLSWWLFKKSLPFTINTLSALIGKRIRIVLVMAFTGPVMTGFFAAASRIMFFITDVWDSFIYSIFPQLSLQYINSKNKLKVLYWQGLLATLIFGLITYTPLFIFSGKILVLLFGKEFLFPVSTLKILSIAGLLYLIIKINFTYFYAINKQMTVLFVSLWALIQGVFLEVMLIPAFGIEGAAAALLINLILILAASILLIIYVNKKLYHRKDTLPACSGSHNII